MEGFEYIFATLTTVEQYTQPIIEMATTLDPPVGTVALINENALFPQVGIDGAEQQANENGIEVVYKEKYPTGTKDLSPLLNQVKNRDPDLLIAGGYTGDMILLQRQAQEVGLDVPLTGFLLGLIVALLLNRPFRGQGFVRSWIVLPWVVPVAVIAILWRWMLDASAGVVNWILMGTGLRDAPIVFLGDPSNAFPSLVGMNSWRFFPFLTLIILAALQTVPEQEYEAARVDGATRWLQFRTITFPHILPVLAVLGLVSSAPVIAHHSITGEYDPNKTVTLKGVVTKIEWTNPHARIYVEGKDETGKLQVWDFELGPPNGLMRNGWNRNSLKQGHQVTVEGFRSKTSDKVANARTVRLPDGRQVFAGSSFNPDEPTK